LNRRHRAGDHRRILLAVLWSISGSSSAQARPHDLSGQHAGRWASLIRIWPSLLLILLVLVLLLHRIATPTEVGALGALLAGVIGAVFGG